ncbi:hypothetical protein CERZMDRAFT_97878 [Cercospora zeae-maydis SCOH1-5]|uniref:Uncharacterized protein n=1 Tax=Cercospora zeae-maydis SCOH1-5 TaxID=717836 RepID=A0A6A6FEN0_9PEZI|nr:hypothetical protein CERZMDRAFT_97878 [Cercospora zeae-maydis SCOH1-5]
MEVSAGDVKAEVGGTPEAASSQTSHSTGSPLCLVSHMQHVMLRPKKPSLHLTAVAGGKKCPLRHCLSTSSAAASGHERGACGKAATAISKNEPTIVSEDGTRTLRSRKHGSRALPVPEILDPLYLTARHKYRQSKASQTSHTSEISEPRTLTPLQRALAVNPYARALAATVRQCSLTRVRLPIDFLFPFGLFMPRQGGSKPSPTKPYFKPLKGYGYRTVSPPGLVGHVSYVLAQKSVVQSLGGKKGKRGGSWVRIADQKTRHDYARLMGKPGEGSIKPSVEWEWDDQMAENVLDILRASVTSGLKYAHPHGLIKRVSEVEVKDASAVVRFKRTGPEDDAGDSLTDEWSHIAKFDLAKLCVDFERHYLMRKLGIEDDVMILVKGSKSLKASLALQRLQSYIDS